MTYAQVSMAALRPEKGKGGRKNFRFHLRSNVFHQRTSSVLTERQERSGGDNLFNTGRGAWFNDVQEEINLHLHLRKKKKKSCPLRLRHEEIPNRICLRPEKALRWGKRKEIPPPGLALGGNEPGQFYGDWGGKSRKKKQ